MVPAGKTVDRLFAVIRAHAENLQALLAIFAMHIYQMGDGLAAGDAPGGKEIQYKHMIAEAVIGHNLAGGGDYLELWGGLACLWSGDCSDRQQHAEDE